MKAELELDLHGRRRPERDAGPLARGVGRLFGHMGYGVLVEFRLSSGRRVDLIGLNRRGEVVIAEIKSSVADFRADHKWPEYLAHCDRFYFAVAEDFPRDLAPAEVGLIIADRFVAEVVRAAPTHPMAGTLRSKETRRFALYAANRLRHLQDPEP